MSNQTELATIDRGEDRAVGFTLQPKTMEEALKVCNYLASSSLVPKNYQGKPQDILVAINWGQEVGLKPLQALNSIAVVNGTPSMYGPAPLALVRNHPEFEFILEDNEAFAYARDHIKGWEHLAKKNPDDTSICVVKRRGEPAVVREFSKQDVKQANLGNVHNSYPKDMRKYRARSRALEATFGDVLKGIKQAEILEEDQQMIEEGKYDEVNIHQDKPASVKDAVLDKINPNSKASTAKEVTEDEAATEEQLKKIMNNAHLVSDDRQAEITKLCSQQDLTYHEAEAILDELRDAYKAQSESDPAGNEQLITEINEVGKSIHGKAWYKESKAYVANINEEAGNLLDLNAEELEQLKKMLLSKQKQGKG